ncbi:hypothetical protein, partial [Paenarthrobacter sp. Z7-10]|uniref:hypothetical protein n=1 Tax=Paenarthrobacter sp. Z7-10 TaxID=2787635 RepID=UPI0022A91F14
ANKNHGTNDDQAVTMTTNAPPGTTGWGVFVPETSSKTLTPSSSNNATVNTVPVQSKHSFSPGDGYF